MNVQELRLRYYNLSQDIKKIWHKFRTEIINKQGDEETHVMSEDEKLDESLKESFPASDPPGHYSKSSEDRALH